MLCDEREVNAVKFYKKKNKKTWWSYDNFFLMSFNGSSIAGFKEIYMSVLALVENLH